MFCPRCGAEYRPGFTQCADCLVPLVDRLPGEGAPVEVHGSGSPGADSPEEQPRGKAPRPDLKLVTVFATGDPALAALVKSTLQAADIKFMTRGEEIQHLFGLGVLPYGFNPIAGPVEFLVVADDAGEAVRLLEDLTAGGADAEESGVGQ